MHAAPVARPICLWRSPDWLTPYGASEVALARLGSALRPGDVITRARVLSFIRSSPAHRNSLEWLLAAVDHTMETERSLVIAARSVDEAASWIGAVSYLTAAAVAIRLSWTTFERAGTVAEAVGKDIRLIFVPHEDLDELLIGLGGDDTEPLVVDPAWQLDDPSDGKWHTAHQSFPAAPQWQDAMLDLFALDEDDAERVLELMDETCSGLTPPEASDLPRHWPLSAAMLAGGVTEEDGRAERISALRLRAKESTLTHPKLRTLFETEPATARQAAEAPLSIGATATPAAAAGVTFTKPATVASGPTDTSLSSQNSWSADLPSDRTPGAEQARPVGRAPALSGAPARAGGSTGNLERLIDQHRDDPTAAMWLVNALEAVLGLEPLSFASFRLPDSADDSRTLAEQLLDASSSSEMTKAAAAHWLVRYWLLQDSDATAASYRPTMALNTVVNRHVDRVLPVLVREMQTWPSSGAVIVIRSCLRGAEFGIRSRESASEPLGYVLVHRALTQGDRADRQLLAEEIIHHVDAGPATCATDAVRAVRHFAGDILREGN
jgi:hypothetical protein